jgi:transglutaminase-like putative cysteine protease
MRYHVFRFFQRGLLMPITASVVLVTFTWLLIFPTALAAQTQAPHPPQAPASSSSDEAELTETLAKIKAKLAMLHAKLAKAAASQLERKDLQRLWARLDLLDTRVRKAFDQIAQHLKDTGMPTEILQRHQAMVATYDTELATLRQHLDTLAAATNDDTRKDTAAQALQYLQKKQPRRMKPRFDPEKFPFRAPDGKVRPPKATQKEFDSSLWDLRPTLTATAELLPGLLAQGQAATLPALPTPEDLAPTEDVQITDEIKTLAAALENNPVKIYNWVHDTIEFLPTYGSIQGAHLTLQTKRGNAFDTANLLIALLRAANIHARYVYGTVQIPITQVMDWVGGVTVPEAALQILGQGGIPNTGLVQGGTITAVKLEHVWVEAWVDFQPSRGAVHRQGDTWVPLDAAFKRYRVTPGIDIQAQVLFDAQAFLAQATQGATVNVQEGWVKSLHQANINAFLLGYQEQV